ncbi:hypothetical protein IQ07DRAFT_648668 [Pyrenochaeta sp. DS3sAY3a]|nr:hypothetical protein IQ07DRAFT_648668 [Pyrenochaeta sp. DS3sAY3a]
MASLNLVTITKPTVYHVEKAFTCLHSDLESQDEYLRAGDAPNVRTALGPSHKNPPDALDIARVITTHFGFVPDRLAFEVLIFGQELDAAAIKARRERFKRIAQMYEIPPQDAIETPQEIQDRLALVNKYRAAWRDVQDKY